MNALGAPLAEFARTWWERHDRSPLRVARWVILWIPMGLAILLASPIALLGRMAGYRFLGINAGRIGHLAIEPDCFLKERALGRHKGVRPVACAPGGQAANQALLECWRPHIRWVTDPVLCALLRPLEWHPLLNLDVTDYARSPTDSGDRTYTSIARQWGDRPPVIPMPAEIEEAGAAAFRELGIPADGWFVCVHNREGGYSPHDEDWHSYRNCTIASYTAAIERITAAGGWCVRMGDPTMSPLPPLRNTVDYAHYPRRSDALDLYLLSHCRFFLGNSSGPFLVSSIFGKPVALANMTPAERVLPYGPRDIGIPKLLRRQGSEGAMPFREMFAHPCSRYHFSARFASDNLELIDNSAEEILALADEMLARLGGGLRYTDDDERLQAGFKQMMAPRHFSFGAASRVGRDFLLRHRALLD